MKHKYETVLNIDKSEMCLNRHIRIISGVMMLKIQLRITEIYYILTYIQIENSYFKF